MNPDRPRSDITGFWIPNLEPDGGEVNQSALLVGYPGYLEYSMDEDCVELPIQTYRKIFNYIDLTRLVIVRCPLLNIIPAEIGRIQTLTTLTLNDNRLTSIPPSFGNLINLESLDLHSNELVNLPTELKQLVKLENLSLAGNRISEFPPIICNLINLRWLSLDFNGIQSIPLDISNLIELRNLCIGSNQLSSVPSSLGKLTKLTLLGLSCNRLTSIPSSLANIDYLLLSNNNLETIPQDFAFTKTNIICDDRIKVLLSLMRSQHLHKLQTRARIKTICAIMGLIQDYANLPLSLREEILFFS